MTKQWMLYILECADGTYYTGITNDLNRRVTQHNARKASRYTRLRIPVRLVYQENCKDRSHASTREYEVKALSRKEKEFLASTQKKPGT